MESVEGCRSTTSLRFPPVQLVEYRWYRWCERCLTLRRRPREFMPLRIHPPHRPSRGWGFCGSGSYLWLWIRKFELEPQGWQVGASVAVEVVRGRTRRCSICIPFPACGWIRVNHCFSLPSLVMPNRMCTFGAPRRCRTALVLSGSGAGDVL